MWFCLSMYLGICISSFKKLHNSEMMLRLIGRDIVFEMQEKLPLGIF